MQFQVSYIKLDNKLKIKIKIFSIYIILLDDKETLEMFEISKIET